MMETGLRRQIRIAVHLYDIRQITGTETHIDPGVAAATHRIPGASSCVSDPLSNALPDLRGTEDGRVVILEGCLLPLGSEGDDAGVGILEGAEVNLG